MSTEAISSNLPEDHIAEKGIPTLPAFLKDDSDAILARNCLEDLFARFNLINQHEHQLSQLEPPQTLSYKRKRSMHNTTRRRIAPAAMLALTYLMERAAVFWKVDKSDLQVGKFFARAQQILKKIREDDSVKNLIEPYTWEYKPGQSTRQRVETPMLAELRVAIAKAEITIGHVWTEKVRDLKAYEESLNLAILQWQSVKIFVQWKTELGREEFSETRLRLIRNRLLVIETELSNIRRRA